MGASLYNDKTLTFASFAVEECYYCMVMRECVCVSVGVFAVYIITEKLE